ncbi:hypothetical protein BDV12DRAFT_200663 [Aspergillus spectabilis]
MKSSVDITWVIGDAMIWSNVEPCIGIVSACLPTLRPFLRRIPQLRLFGSTPFSANRRSSKPTNPSEPDSITASANRSAYRSTTGKRGHFRPEEDEISLTTDVGRESSLRPHEGDGSQDVIPMQIKVNQRFQ